VYDIPIANITLEFLEYLQLMKQLRIDVGGDFIVMAAMLMRIKAKMLLPRTEVDENDEALDPRTELVQRLLEYKQFKASSEELQYLHKKQSKKYPRGVAFDYNHQEEDAGAYLKDITLFDLLSIYKDIMENLPDNNPYELHQEEIHVDEQIEFIRTQLMKKKSVKFKNVMKMLTSKLQVVVAFMALLEMFRNQEIKLEQKTPFGDIKIFKVA
jgi:segregation and condensation protein A